MSAIIEDSGSDGSEQPKLCVKCVFVATNYKGEWELYKCFAPENKAGINYVTGDTVLKIPLCKELREYDLGDHQFGCGIQGRWWKKVSDKVELTKQQYQDVVSEKKSLKSIGLADI